MPWFYHKTILHCLSLYSAWSLYSFFLVKIVILLLCAILIISLKTFNSLPFSRDYFLLGDSNNYGIIITIIIKKVFQNDPRRFKKKLDWIQLFLNRFDHFCSAHVNKRTVHVSKIFLKNNRNRSEPYRTVKKKPEWIFAFTFSFLFFLFILFFYLTIHDRIKK